MKSDKNSPVSSLSGEGDAKQVAALMPLLPEDYRAIFEAWQKGRVGRRETTAQDYARVLLSFAECVERKQLRAMPRRDVVQFRDWLFAQGQHPTTINRKIGILKTLFRSGLENELLTDNPAALVRLQVAHPQKPRVAFSLDDLNCLFASPVYSGRGFSKGGGGEACFWLPLMALFSGCRLEELAQLLVSDVREEAALGFYLHISDEAPHSHLKNVASRRRVPVHDVLIQCGFLRYVARQPREGLLFPDLKANPRHKLGGYFSNYFSHYLREQVGIQDRRKVFHSFRHTFKDACRDAGLDEEVHDALTGHSGAGAGRGYGNEEYPLAPLFVAMKKITISGLAISHLLCEEMPHLAVCHGQQPISSYFGVVISVAESDRLLQPRIYVHYLKCRVCIEVLGNGLLTGDLPEAKACLVLAWLEIHKEELLTCWEIWRQTGAPFQIRPLH